MREIVYVVDPIIHDINDDDDDDSLHGDKGSSKSLLFYNLTCREIQLLHLKLRYT